MLDEWTGDMDLEDIVMGLLFLMQNPQIDDPLNGMFRGDEKYTDFVRKACDTLINIILDTYLRPLLIRNLFQLHRDFIWGCGRAGRRAFHYH